MEELNRNELSMEDMDLVNGGVNWNKILTAVTGGGIMGAVAGTTIGLITGPVGWCALGGAVITAAAAGGAAALVSKDD